jgi:hypothetical protein
MTTPPTPPPGWYPDPSGAPGQRYWDGRAWHASPGPPPSASSTTGRAWLVVLAVVVLFFGGCAALIAIGARSSDSGSGFGSPEPAPMNSTVSDGKFSFRVTNVERRTQGAGLSQPRGEYVLVTMTVKNTGGEPQTFFANNQKLFDASGNEYEADSMAAIALNGADSGWMEDMNPGFTITTRVPFDVPRGTQPDRIELHDSAFSQGVAVKLG